jgi:hypothetical protein
LWLSGNRELVDHSDTLANTNVSAKDSECLSLANGHAAVQLSLPFSEITQPYWSAHGVEKF